MGEGAALVPVAAIGGAISGAGSLIGGILGNNAANNASQTEQSATNQAIAYQKQQSANALGQQQQTTNQITGELSPFLNTGQNATASLNSLLSPGGSLTQGYGSFTAPTAQQAAQQPGYQFQLQQGLNALQNSAAARGGLLSTGTAKNLEDYAQGDAASNYNNVYNQALQTYGTNYNTFANNQNNLYSRLYGASGQGLSAGQSLGGLQQAGAQGQSNIYQNSGQQVGNNLNLLGQEAAGGIVGGSNALSAGLQGGLNGAGVSLASVLGQGTTPPPGLQQNLNQSTYNSLASPGGLLNNYNG